MKKRKNISIIIAVLLVISIGNFFRISSQASNIRTVDFISILAIGVLAGLLIGSLVNVGKKE